MEETLEFTAETGKLLNLVANALYSEKEVFLRELISNASDACDRLRFESIAKPDLLKDHPSFGVHIIPNKEGKKIIIIDTGIGMNRKDLIDNLGTIARSGTGKFLEKLAKTDKENQLELIGQFGVGFYSALMVAENIELLTRKAGTNKVIKWQTDGSGKYKISDDIDPKEFGTKEMLGDYQLEKPLTCGTIITLTLKEDADEYLESSRLNHIVRTYSNHVNVPVHLQKDSGGTEQINDSEALWLKPKSEIKPEHYDDFYHSETLLFDKQWFHIHFHTEGMLDYYGLLFIPTKRPFDLFYPEKISRIKLYVKRVFITGDCEPLIPAWLRFVTGVIDASDIDLNISREMIQSSPVLFKIKKNLTKRILDALKTKQADDFDGYTNFFEEFGVVMKEGLCDPMESHKEDILPLVLGYSLKQEKLISIDQYVDNAPKEQRKIYYLTGENLNLMKQSPHLEEARAQDYDVFLLSDPVDEFWPNLVGQYRDFKFQSVQNDDSSEEDEGADAKSDEAIEKPSPEMQALIDVFTEILGDEVANVKLNNKLQSSPVRLAVSKGNSPRLERLMQVHRAGSSMIERRLELNGNHKLIQALAKQLQDKRDDTFDSALYLLYEQSRMMDGDSPADVLKFGQKLNDLLEKSYL